jgi:hypothetical protein
MFYSERSRRIKHINRQTPRIVWLMLSLCILVSCAGINQTNVIPAAEDHLLGIAVTPARDENFERAFAKAIEAKMQFTNLPVNWDDVEKTPNKFSFNPNFLEIANVFYPANKIRVALELNPVNTVKKSVPTDLADKSFSDPKMIERYKKFLDWAFPQIPDLQLTSLTIGNEIDVFLGDDRAKWKDFQVFFGEVSKHAKKLRPNLKVGTKITFAGLSGKNRENLSETVMQSDFIMPTYYAVDEEFRAKKPAVVGEDFALLTKLYPNREIYFLEIGYPSSSVCGSSEEAQAEFIKEVFKAWKAHKKQVKLLNFTWLTDISEKTVDELVGFYGVPSRCFAEYLRTLGLRTNDDRDKQAFRQLKIEAEKINF